MRVTTSGGTTRFRIVGRSVFPLIPGTDPQPLAEGAAFTRGGLDRKGTEPTDGYALVRLAPGVDRSRAVRTSGRSVAASSRGVPRRRRRSTGSSQIDALPGLLAAFMAVVAVVAVGYALVTAVRRRRHDLAVLKTLGYKRAQVRGRWRGTPPRWRSSVSSSASRSASSWDESCGVGSPTTSGFPAPPASRSSGAGDRCRSPRPRQPGRGAPGVAAAHTRPAVVLRSE